MDGDKYFSSDWLNAEDVKKPMKVTIKSVNAEKVGEDEKLVVAFKETEKTLILNKTNYKRIKEELGSETDHWKGKKLELYQIETAFKGQEVSALRVKVLQGD